MKPYWQQDGNKIYQGHVLDILKTMPDESVQCCVTSPPYWGLRDYGIPPQIWDVPEGLESCVHEWGDERFIKNSVPRDHDGPNKFGNTRGKENHRSNTILSASQGQFCQLCGAWRGSLGLEPTPELYTKHIVDIFREVKRVLRKDGVLWLNMGDVYATGAGKVGDHPGGGEQGRRWKGYRGAHGPHGKERYVDAAMGPYIQPNRLPLPGYKPKDLIGLPWLVAFALRNDGWWLRSDIIWEKPNPKPESVKDRPTLAHEHIFLFARSRRYFYDNVAIKEEHGYNRWTNSRNEDAKEIDACYDGRVGKTSMMKKGIVDSFPEGGRNKRTVWAIPDSWDTSIGEGGHGRIKKTRSGNKSRKEGHNPKGNVASSVPWEGTSANKRTIWTIPTFPFPEAHFATFPPKLIEPCILAGSPAGGIVLDPFIGSGTTGIVAYKHDRKFIGIELSEPYLKDIAIPRIERETAQLKLFN